ncbi:hypothetical protein JT739_11650 [Tepidanaerobacter sp. GT38]|uniref:hypothetical protein n=1 Tax=Tepidanaerobacter sp. GT38 TaxID=2722793 RepID=UPI001F2A6572|nr:hypothetical protein [Tepidanaerobacter sp. GT38]MCG1013245.1 hypothetical protein [Tepidanaerobacter sp. GT38]
MEQKQKDKSFSANRTALEATIWSFIKDNIIRTYENELAWIEDMREAISNIPNENDVTKNVKAKVDLCEEKSNGQITYTVCSNSKVTYVYFSDSKNKIGQERNILGYSYSISRK